MILLLLLCAVLHPTKQDDEYLPAVVSWLPTSTILTFSVTNTTSSNGTNNQTYTIKPTLESKSLRITWSEQADSNGNHLREVKDLKNENQKASFNETEYKTECTFAKESSWRIFRRLPEDEFWLLCDNQLFVSIPLSSYGISINQMMTVDLTAMTGSYNLDWMSRRSRTEDNGGRSDVGKTESMLNISYVAWPDFTFSSDFEVQTDGNSSNDDDEIKNSGKESGTYAVSFKSDTNSGFESKFTLTTEEFDEIIEEQWDSLVMKITRYNETTEKNETIKDIGNSTELGTTITVETQDSCLMFLGVGLRTLNENDASRPTVAVR
eukprot:sb/3466822/